MRSGLILIVTAVLFLPACSAAVQLREPRSEAITPDKQAEPGRIRADRLQHRVEYLASEDLAGRGPGSFQADSAAAYVLGRFLDLGLDPGIGGNSHLLSDPVFVRVHAQGTVGLRDQDRGYTFNRDWAAHGVSAQGRDSTSVVFVGYGITAPEYGYDDYRNVLTRGRAVLALMGEPGAGLPDGPFLSTASPPYHGDPFRKALNAQAHGASSLLLAYGDPTGLDEDRLVRHPEWSGFGVAGIPVFKVTRAVAQNLLDTEGLDLGDLQFMIDRSLDPHSADLPDAWIEGVVSMHRAPGRMITVAGCRPGTGHGTVVVAAAYDGLGMGVDRRDPMLHPGAGDNASGLAVLMETAAAIMQSPPAERSVCFVAYAGRHYSAAGLASFISSAGIHPSEIQGMVDIGPLGTGEVLNIHGLHSAPGLARVLEDVESGLLRSPRTVRHEARPDVGALKHMADFEIPGILVCGPGDRRLGTPGDTPDWLDYEAMASAGELILGLVEALASDTEPIEYVP